MNPFACGPSKVNPFALLTTWISKRSLRKPHFPNGFALKRPIWKERVVAWSCAVLGEIEEKGMESFDKKNGIFSDTVEDDCRESSSSCETLSSEEKQSFDGGQEKSEVSEREQVEDEKMVKSRSKISEFSLKMDNKDMSIRAELVMKTSPLIPLLSKDASGSRVIEMMKERFSKLLLGEDMSGCGKGVCTALAISNAITNLCATIFGQIWRLEPLNPEKKTMWQREMELLLCVSDHVVEMIPSWQTFSDGKKLEVMTCKPRSDLFINLPALHKLDNMLLEILDSFHDQEFWYVNDQGILAQDSDGSAPSIKSIHRQEEKWWLPVPRIPTNGLCENSRNQLQHKRECANQILKAAMAINGNALAEMEVPESYLNSLPKNGRESLGDVMHQYITSDQFSSECLLDCLEFSSEHQALEIANRLESSVYMWRQKMIKRPKSKMVDDDKRELFADRAESIFICLKQRFPGLTQTTLDMSKIQFNKDVGKSILESYSRVLESLAFSIVARIDDLLYVDDLTKKSVPPVTAISHRRVLTSNLLPILSTPYATTYRKPNGLGFSVKKILTAYLSGEPKGRNYGNIS